MQKKKILSTIGFMLFGPLYLAYRGYLKEALAVLGFFCVMIYGVIPQFVSADQQDFWIRLLGVSTNTALAMAWEHYLALPSQPAPNSWPRLANLGIVIVTFGAGIFGLVLLEESTQNRQYAKAVALQQEGKFQEAFPLYERLCAQDVGEACYNIGLMLGEDDKETIKVLWNRACELNVADACFNLGDWEEEAGNDAVAKTYFVRSCELGDSEACSK